MAFFEAGSSGRLQTILNDDINQLERFLDHGANEILQLVTTVLAVGAAMVWLSPGVAGVAFLPIPVILWGRCASSGASLPATPRCGTGPAT